MVSIALSTPPLRQALAGEPDSFFTAHLLPADYRLDPRRFAYLLGFVFPYFESDQKQRVMGRPQDDCKVVF